MTAQNRTFSKGAMSGDLKLARSTPIGNPTSSKLANSELIVGIMDVLQ
jgi:hypothetical protein